MMNQITKSMIDPSSIGMKSYAWSLDLFSFFVFQNRDKKCPPGDKKIILLPHFSLQEKMKTMHYYYEKKTSINEEKLCVKYF